MSLKVERLSGPDALRSIERDWERLDVLTVPRSPFSSPLWNSVWWTHYRKQGILSRDEFFVHVVRAPDGALVAIAPLFRRSWPGIGPLRLRFVQFFGADAAITDIRGIVCAPENEEIAWHALRQHFQNTSSQWDIFRFDGLRGQPEHIHWLKQPDVAALTHGPNYFVQLPGSWDELHKRVNGNFRRNMRKQREIFDAEGHAYTVELIDAPSELPAALDRLFALHSLRADSDGMEVKHPDRFADPLNRGFISDYVLQMAGRGRVRLFELKIGGTTVASQLTIALDDALWFLSTGFDTSWRKYGVMTMLTVEVMKWAIDAKFRVVNLSCGHDRGKTRWNPAELILSSFLWRAPGLRGLLLARVYRSVEMSRQPAAPEAGVPARGRRWLPAFDRPALSTVGNNLLQNYCGLISEASDLISMIA